MSKPKYKRELTQAEQNDRINDPKGEMWKSFLYKKWIKSKEFGSTMQSSIQF